MPDWGKVAGGRAENARKAMELLENTAGKGYEFTPEEGLGMITGLQDALDSLKEAYRDRLPENPVFAASPAGTQFSAAAGHEPSKDELVTIASPVIAVEGNKEPRYLEDAELIALSNSRNAATAGGHTANGRSDMPLVIPHWAQIKEFTASVPAGQLPAYILHIGDRMYEDALKFDQKS